MVVAIKTSPVFAAGIPRQLFDGEFGLDGTGHPMYDISPDGELMKRYKFSFRDCLIVRAALHSGAELLLSEDLSSGQKVGGMTIDNPFR